MKKIIALIICLLVLLPLCVSCGNNPPSMNMNAITGRIRTNSILSYVVCRFLRKKFVKILTSKDGCVIISVYKFSKEGESHEK